MLCRAEMTALPIIADIIMQNVTRYVADAVQKCENTASTNGIFIAVLLVVVIVLLLCVFLLQLYTLCRT